MRLPDPLPSVAPICPYFYECGGCDSQDVAYAAQIRVKDLGLRALFGSLIAPSAWETFQASAEEYPVFYRNKIRFAFVGRGGILCPSRHGKERKSADIAVEKCYLQSEQSNAVARHAAAFGSAREWEPYDPLAGTGWLKHILIREGKGTGEMLVALVTGIEAKAEVAEWGDEVRRLFPAARSIWHVRTEGKNNEKTHDTLLHGAPGIYETVGTKRFFISPHAFFQPNGAMVETLYETVRKIASRKPSATLWDLYAGSSTMGIYLSEIAGRVVCFESNVANVADAETNISSNGTSNVRMVGGTVEATITDAFVEEDGSPDLIVVDPPRTGLSARAKDLLSRLPSHRIIYVSCNPLTCVRDCEELCSRGYRAVSARGVDMFPHTAHCEVIIELEK